MKTIHMKFRLLIPALALLVFSCDDKDDPVEPTKTELLTSSSWKYDSGGIDNNNDGVVDMTFEQTGAVQACMLDNTGKFNTGGSGVADEGASKCNASAPQTSPFTWSFTNNESMLSVVGGGFFGFGGAFMIKNLTATQLTVSKDTSFMGLQIKMIANLKH